MVLTTPEEGELDCVWAIKEAAWYKDEFGEHMEDKSKKTEKKNHANKAMMYDADGDASVCRIHELAEKGYVGTPGAAKLDLEKKGST